MSQNRLSVKDRLDAAHDYEVNLKAELEILSLHEKLDELRDKKCVLAGMRVDQARVRARLTAYRSSRIFAPEEKGLLKILILIIFIDLTIAQVAAQRRE